MIAPTTIDEVKARANVYDLVSEVVRLRKSGVSFTGLCPFHKEKTPSFHVHPGRNYFYCFGCKENGGPIDFVMKNEGLKFPEAVRELAGRLGINIEEGTPRDRAEVDRERRDRESLYQVNAIAAAFFERALWGERPARGAGYAHEELDDRGLRSRPGDDDGAGRALAAFRIGYAPAAWRALAAHLERQRIPLEVGEKAGLLVRAETGGRLYDRFRHRLMFPVLDHLGRVVAFSGRILPEPLPRDCDSPDFRMGDKPAKYVNSPETPIYKKGDCLFGLWQARDEARARGEALLVEGNFDVVSCHARGLAHAVAPLGTAFTEAQARLLRRFSPAVVIAFDGDSAGRKATWDARVPIRAGRLNARALVLPTGTDPDSFVQKRGPEALEDLARHAPELREHLIRTLLDGKEGGLEARAKRVGAVVKLLGEEPDPTLRALVKSFADRLSGGLVVDGRAPRDLRDLELALRKAMRSPQDADAAAPETPLADPLGFEVVGAILDVPSIAHRSDVAAVVALLGSEDLASAARAAEQVSADDVLAATPEPLRPHMERRMAAPIYDSEASAAAAVLANGERLRARASLDEEARIRKEVALAEAAGNESEVDRLLEVLGQLVEARVHL